MTLPLLELALRSRVATTGALIAVTMASAPATPRLAEKASPVASASDVTWEATVTSLVTFTEPPAAVLMVGEVVARVGEPLPLATAESDTARPLAEELTSTVALMFRLPPAVSVPLNWVVIWAAAAVVQPFRSVASTDVRLGAQPPAIASTRTAPPAAARPKPTDRPSPVARSNTVVLTVTAPVPPLTVVPVPTPLVTWGESTASRSPAAIPTPSAKLPRVTAT